MREESIKALSIAHSSDTMCIHTYKCSYIMHTNVRMSYTIGTYLTLYIRTQPMYTIHTYLTLYVHTYTTYVHYTYISYTIRTYICTHHAHACIHKQRPTFAASTVNTSPASKLSSCTQYTHKTCTVHMYCTHVLYTCTVHMYCTHVCIGRHSTTLHSTVAQIHSYVTPPPPPHQHYNSTLCTFTAR